MAQIEAFEGIRYTVPDVSQLIAPPYDILDEIDKRRLLMGDEHNIVAIDLPHLPPKDAGPDETYEKAAGELTCWLDIKTLSRDPEPAIYVYYQRYRLGNKTLLRKMFIARLRLEPFGSGSVYPHEETFGGPKEDRLKLTISTRCNLSPVFALYPDKDNQLAAHLEAAIDNDPDQVGVMDNVEHALWSITSEPEINALRGMMADKPVFIADGHHRYGTALMYRQREVDQIGEPLSDDPINFVLCCFCSMEDPGAIIQPYFRSIVGMNVTPKELEKAVSDSLDCTSFARPGSADELAKKLAAAGPQAFALYFAKQDTCLLLKPKKADFLAKYEPSKSAAWRGSAYAIFHRYLIDEVMKPRYGSGKDSAIHYHKSMKETLDNARENDGIAALMPATSMDQLREICMARELMPQKSTYFFPKLATGMVINPLY
jgi:uncharacterized protein (DUF1015 family)